MKKYEKRDQQAMAIWAADCAERVLPLFEKAYPQDARPRTALEVCRTWAQTGVFRMAEIRGASLAAHAAARAAKENHAACYAARAAGQAVATAHVAQHVFGSALYALKAIAALDMVQAAVSVVDEYEWQVQRAPARLRPEIRKRVIVQKCGDKIAIKIPKDKDY